MSLFSKTGSCLGVDIGAHNIKVVELSSVGNRPSLVTYGFSDRHFNEAEPDIMTDPAVAADILKQILKQTKVKTNKAVLALPAAAVFSYVISLTDKKGRSAKELDAVIRNEAQKVITQPLNEMVLNYYPLETVGKEKIDGEVVLKRFLLTAAPLGVIKKYLDFFRLAGLVNAGLETESFALSRALVGSDPSAVLVADVGEISTTISVIFQGVPVLTRNLSLSGKDYTGLIGRSSGLNLELAEQFKRDLNHWQEAEALAPFKRLLDNLVQEIRYTFNSYQEQAGLAAVAPIEKIILTGGGSILPQLDVYLAESLKIRTFVGDPWARITYPEDLRPILDQIGPRLAVALGLALRAVERKSK